MSVSSNHLSYPVVIISRHGDIRLCVDEKTLNTSSYQELKGGWYDDMTVYDGSGRTYKIKSAVYVKGAGSYFGYGMLLLTRVVKIKLTIDGDIPQMSRSEFVGILVKDIRKWGWPMASETVRNDIKAISDASSLNEVLDTLRKYFGDRKTQIEGWKPSLKRRYWG